MGGSEFAAREFAERMAGRGHDVTVLTSCAKSYTDWSNYFEPGETYEHGVRVVRLPTAGPREQNKFEPLHSQVLTGRSIPLYIERRWSKAIGPDLVGYTKWLIENAKLFDAVFFKAYLYTTATQGIAATWGRAPIVFNPEAHPEEMLNLSLFDGVFRLVNAYQFQTQEEEALVCSRFGIDPLRVMVGIGVERIDGSQLTGAVTKKFGLSPEKFVVCIGRVAHGKGTFELVEYFRRFKLHHPGELKLVLIGETDSAFGADQDVIATGFLSESDKTELIHNALALIQPSYLESFSIVLAESWSAGVPVIARSSSQVLRGQVRRSGGGLLFNNAEDFEEALSTFSENPELAKHMGGMGRRYVDENYHWPVVLDRLTEVINLARADFSVRNRKQ